MRAWNKLFGIGLSKTGTLSLDAAFSELGLRSIHYPPAESMLTGRFAVLDAFDAASDISVSVFFRELDAAFPGSRYVLTVRDLEGWLDSMRAHLASRDSGAYTGDTPAGRLRERMFGCRRFDRARLIEAYHRHHTGVRAYFADRPGDLLKLNICAGEGWSKLAPFLGVPAPATAFPHRHKRSRPVVVGAGEPPIVHVRAVAPATEPVA